MNVIILEGHNDLIFIETLFNKIFKMHRFVKYDHKKGRGYREMMESILNENRYHYLKENFGFIIYGDNGKTTVISKIIPRFTYDVIRKIPEKLTVLVILDENGTPLHYTIKQICKNIKSKNIPHANISCGRTIYVSSDIDSSYAIELKVYFISQSLEKNLVAASLEHIKIKQIQKEKLMHEDPHKALNQIAMMLGVSKDDLIRKSIIGGWFNDSSWFTELTDNLKEIVEVDE